MIKFANIISIKCRCRPGAGRGDNRFSILLYNLCCLSVILLAGCVASRSWRHFGPSLESVAEQYIGAAYILDPLGEGGGFDTDPIRRTDAFDCLTFVETVLAEASGIDLQTIRYADGEIDWFERNHWTETDWIPNAVSLGLITPVETGHSAETFAHVDLQKWYKEKTGMDKIAEPFEMSVSYIPRVYLTPELLAKMPSQSVVFFIKCGVNNSTVQGDMIVHTGFVFGDDLVHAGQKTGVVRVPFLEYMADGKFCGAAFYKVF